MKKYLSSFSLLFALFFTQCTKDGSVQDQLPPITTSGANTFGCKVNGKVWLPYGSFGVNALTINDVSKSYIKPSAQILARNRKNNELSDIDLTIFDFRLVTYTYQIKNQFNDGLVYSDGNFSYEPIDTFGIIKISRLDTNAKIISGTFNFIGYTDHTHNQKVNITDGRFDLHYPLTIKIK